jgi:chromate transporter
MQILIDFFLVFVKIGFCSFGGLSMIPVINEEMVSHGWMTLSEVADIIAIAEMTPGPLGINAATFSGMRSAGVLGAVAANLGAMTPSLTVCLLASVFLAKVKGNPLLDRFMFGIRPVCIGMMAATCITLFPNYQTGEGMISLAALAIGVVALVLLVKCKLTIPKVILISAVLGLILGG